MKTINKTVTSVACLALLSICAPQGFADPRPSAVTVINTPDNPVPVTVQDEIATRSADNPAFQPYAQDQSTHVETGGVIIHHYDVPQGKRLVIEYIAARANADTPQNVEFTVFVLKRGGTYTRFPLPSTDERKICFGPFCSRLFGGSQSLRLYSDAGPDSVQVKFEIPLLREGERSFLGAESAISGYLVDVSP